MVFGDLSPWEEIDRYRLSEYEATALNEVTLAAEWTGADAMQLLVEAGYAPWCEPQSRRLHFLSPETHIRHR